MVRRVLAGGDVARGHLGLGTAFKHHTRQEEVR